MEEFTRDILEGLQSNDALSRESHRSRRLDLFSMSGPAPTFPSEDISWVPPIKTQEVLDKPLDQTCEQHKEDVDSAPVINSIAESASLSVARQAKKDMLLALISAGLDELIK